MANKNNKKYLLFFFILLILLILLFLINVYNQKNIENFKSFEDNIITLLNPKYKNNNEIVYYKDNSENINIPKSNKKETRFIYIIPLNKKKYLFYNKKKQNYLYLTNDFDNNLYNMNLYDIKNDLVGKLLINESSKFIFKLDFISKDNYINIHFYNDYKEAKIIIDNDSEYFYVKQLNNQAFNKYNHKRNKEYEIYEYAKKIGKIDYNGKVVVYEEFKKYLSVFGLTYILFDIVNN